MVVLAAIVGIVYNQVSPHGIKLVGNWTPQTLPSGIIVPPSYMPGQDAPVISLAEAFGYYNSGQAIFLDARKKEDYLAGHIHGALQLYMEEFDTEYPRVEDRLPKDSLIVTYCGGDECELSLFLARNLKTEGYNNLRVFFGGWKEWARAGLPISTGANP